MELVIGTYNVCHCANYADKKDGVLPVNIEKTASIFSKFDIAGANEVYRDSLKEELKNQTEKLSNFSGLKYSVFGLGKLFTWGDSIGNAIFSKYPIVESKTFFVPEPTDEEKRPEEKDWYEDRIIVKATVDVGRKIDYISTHFGLNLLEQERIVAKLVEILDDCKNPVVLCGDFNTAPRSKILAPIYERLVSTAEVVGKGNAFTYASFNPYLTLDYIFVSKEFKVKSFEVVDVMASDHFPIKAVVEI